MSFILFSPAYGQLHGGHNQAPPIDFGGVNVALSTILSPEDFFFEEAKSANLSIRFFYSETNSNIKSVTYRVQIFQDAKLVANEYFFDEDGKLDLEIRPVAGCQQEELWKCTKYFGEKHPIAGALYARGDSRPIIQGPIFDKSGDYKFKVDIVGATNPKTMTQSDLNFETFLSIPFKQSFLIKTANAQEFPISIKSFDDQVSNFSFDTNTNKISYNLEFDWSHVDHDVPGIKQSVHLKKDFTSFKENHDVEIHVEGQKLSKNSVLFDTSSENENIIRISIPHEEIMIIQKKLAKEQLDKNSMKIEILPGGQKQLNQSVMTFENGYTAKISWDSELDVGQKIPLTFSFFDSSGKPAKNILYAYSLADSSGKEFLSDIGTNQNYVGILAQNGIHHQSVLIPSAGNYQLKLILTGEENTNFEKFFTTKTDLSISSQTPSLIKTDAIPSWIKNSAGWWSEGTVDDDSFLQGIQWLIKEGIMKIPQTQQGTGTGSNEIPSWIKNNAGWWAEGQIDDNSFIQGIQFLVKQGIIRVS